MIQTPTEEDCCVDEIVSLLNERKCNESIGVYQLTSDEKTYHDVLRIWQNQYHGDRRDVHDVDTMLNHIGKTWQQISSVDKDIRYENSKKHFLSFIHMFAIRLLYVIALFTIVMISVDSNNFIQRQGIVQTFTQDGANSPDVSISSYINT